MKIEVSPELIDEIFVEQLKEHITMLEDRPDEYETPDNRAQLLAGLYITLEFFAYPDDYANFLQERKNR